MSKQNKGQNKDKGDGSIFLGTPLALAAVTTPDWQRRRPYGKCYAFLTRFLTRLTIDAYNVILLVEKDGIKPKTRHKDWRVHQAVWWRQTRGNTGAQSRASAKAERQIAEVEDFKKRIISGKFA